MRQSVLLTVLLLLTACSKEESPSDVARRAIPASWSEAAKQIQTLNAALKLEYLQDGEEDKATKAAFEERMKSGALAIVSHLPPLIVKSEIDGVEVVKVGKPTSVSHYGGLEIPITLAFKKEVMDGGEFEAISLNAGGSTIGRETCVVMGVADDQTDEDLGIEWNYKDPKKAGLSSVTIRRLPSTKKSP